jgi:hypothetical protein
MNKWKLEIIGRFKSAGPGNAAAVTSIRTLENPLSFIRQFGLCPPNSPDLI